MAHKVAKFGGSSVADSIQIEKIKDILDRDEEIRYVVVSAPGKRYEGDSKITDLLYLCKTHVEHHLSYDQLFQVIEDRFLAVQMKLGIGNILEKEFVEIRKNLEHGCSQDYIASRGEYLNGVMIAGYLGMDFVDSQDLIKFDASGRLLKEETDRLLAEELEKHERAVIPGFYGSISGDNIVKTFSRGGSDITGALVARATGAKIYENWTDVSGILMADPRIVDNPKPIREISYKELRELSYMGASVLHEDAIFPARMANIPINIRNTNDPENAGTLIYDKGDSQTNDVVTGIAGSKDFVVIALYKNMMSSERGFFRRILGVLEDMGIRLEHMPTGIDTISIVITKESLGDRLDELVEALEKQLNPDTMEVFEDIGLIATVGRGMSKRPGVSARLFTALAREEVNIRMIDQGSSEMNIIVGVENKDFEKAIMAIYREFEG